MRRIFEKYDTDGKSSVFATELALIFSDMGVEVPAPEDFGGLVFRISGGAPEVRFEQFLHILEALESDESAKLRAVFDRYDADGGGAVSAREVEVIFKDLNMRTTPNGVETAIRKHGVCDAVDFAQFAAVVGHLKKMALKRSAVDVQLRALWQQGSQKNLAATANFATAKLFKETEPPLELKARAIFDRYDEDRGGTIDAAELSQALSDMGADVGGGGVEALLAEHGRRGVDGIATAVNFAEFVEMLKALPPTHTVPCFTGRLREYLDAVAEQLAEVTHGDFPAKPDAIVLDFFVDPLESQLRRDRHGSTNTRCYINAVSPLYLDSPKSFSKQRVPSLGLFDASERDALRGVRPRKTAEERALMKKKKKQLPPRRSRASREDVDKAAPVSRKSRASMDKKPAAASQEPATESQEAESDDAADYGWTPADARGVSSFKVKAGRRRVVEFRVRRQPATARQLQGAMDPIEDDGHIFRR
ncbi:hypothetical protein M885DRAFT_505534 [Pelagophyceae sp. CCMP2097]|nr:hypothetical protein M885DRAFT_505534 [Pelagophyceae sp. CCMP2097]